MARESFFPQSNQCLMHLHCATNPRLNRKPELACLLSHTILQGTHLYPGAELQRYCSRLKRNLALMTRVSESLATIDCQRYSLMSYTIHLSHLYMCVYVYTVNKSLHKQFLMVKVIWWGFIQKHSINSRPCFITTCTSLSVTAKTSWKQKHSTDSQPELNTISTTIKVWGYLIPTMHGIRTYSLLLIKFYRLLPVC